TLDGDAQALALVSREAALEADRPSPPLPDFELPELGHTEPPKIGVKVGSDETEESPPAEAEPEPLSPPSLGRGQPVTEDAVDAEPAAAAMVPPELGHAALATYQPESEEPPEVSSEPVMPPGLATLAEEEANAWVENRKPSSVPSDRANTPSKALPALKALPSLGAELYGSGPSTARGKAVGSTHSMPPNESAVLEEPLPNPAGSGFAFGHSSPAQRIRSEIVLNAERRQARKPGRLVYVALLALMMLLGFFVMRSTLERSESAPTMIVGDDGDVDGDRSRPSLPPGKASGTEIHRASTGSNSRRREIVRSKLELSDADRDGVAPASRGQTVRAGVSTESTALLRAPTDRTSPLRSRTDRSLSSRSSNDRSSSRSASTSKSALLGRLRLKTNRDVTFVHGRRAHKRSMNIYGRRGLIKVKVPSLDSDVLLTYQVSRAGMSVRIAAKPWAIGRRDGLSLGKTPQRPVKAARKHNFTLIKPGQEGPFEVSLIWEPKS
ncbi:MAG: hypothetical protein AAFV29_15075, partial [Myxococcota bacterium]